MADSDSPCPASTGSKKYSSGPLRIIVAIMIITALGVAVTGGLFMHHTRQELSHSYIDQARTSASTEFSQLGTTIGNQLKIIQQWGQDGTIPTDLNDVESLNAKFMPIMDVLPKISGIVIGNSAGQAYFLTREDGKWKSRFTDAERQPGSAHVQFWKKANEPDGKPTVQQRSYDPRKRQWWSVAMNEKDGQSSWTSPYVFDESRIKGVTSSMKWTATVDGKELTYVVGIDLTLTELFEQLKKIRPDTNGKVFLFDDQGDVFEPDSKGQTEPRAFIPVDQVSDPIVADAVRELNKRKDRNIKEIFSFLSEGQRCWFGATKLNPDDEGLAWIGVAVPETDFISESDRSGYVAVILSLVILVAGVVVSVIVLRRYGKQFRIEPDPLFDSDNYEQHILDVIRAGEGDRVEFKSTIRMNLRSEKFGKEIEIAWLKTIAAFMNSEGGILLIGVADDGEVLGLGADAFENEDRCMLHVKNVFNQHIGAEFSASLRYDVKKVQGKEVMVFACTPSEKPVFVINKNDEAFYIRSGPSSAQLPLSKALEYIEQRKESK